MTSFRYVPLSGLTLVLLSALAIFLLGCTDSVVGMSQAQHANAVDIDGSTPAQNNLLGAGAQISDHALTSEVVVAQVGQKTVSQSDLDARISLQLFDLEWAKYELRRHALAGWVAEQQQTKPNEIISIQIKPPTPPRIEPPSEASRPTIGPSEAPITISVFCNYQSIHCARMQATYAQLTQDYKSLLRFVFFDTPLRFHPHALGAAVAARCAHEQGQFEAFHKALWASSDALNVKTYQTTLRQMGLNEERFSSCYESDTYKKTVSKNLAFIEQHDLRNVPLTLINGLYLNGIKEHGTLSFFIDSELQRLGVSRELKPFESHQNLPETKLALRLEGLTLGASPETGSALVNALGSGESKFVRAGQVILDDAILESVWEGYVLIRNASVLERLNLSSGSERDREVSAQRVELNQLGDDLISNIERAALASGNVLDSDDLPPADIGYQYRGVVAPKGERPLSQEWVKEQLTQKTALEAHFQPAELEVEGVRIMRLENVADSDFYRTLGLQENDVIMRVNGEWVHEHQNTLFSSLENNDRLSVVLMRKGLPVHYQYNIQ